MPLPWEVDLVAVQSVLIGAGIAWLVTWWYYRRAGAELRDEAVRLRRLTTIVLNALESARGLGIVLTRDANGEIIALTIRAEPGTGELTLTGFAPTVTIGVPPPQVQGVGTVTPLPSSPREDV